jgi:hypothetical protein
LPEATIESVSPPERTIAAGAEVVPEIVTVSEFTTEPLAGLETLRVRCSLLLMVDPFSSGILVRIWTMRLVDQTVTEKRIPRRNPASPAQKIDGPKRLLRIAGISIQDTRSEWQEASSESSGQL